MVLSEEPLTTSLSLYCRHAMPRLWPFKVRTNSQVLVFHTCDRKEGREPHRDKIIMKRLTKDGVCMIYRCIQNALNEDAIIKTGKITPLMTCGYSLQLIAGWVIVHRRFLHTVSN